MGFNLDDYEPVSSRINKFYGAHPDGRIITELVHYLSDSAVFKAEIWIGEVLVATGWEEEVRNSSHINKSSHLANAETGAVGRGLANYNLAGSDPTKRPSREEMSKVQRTSNGPAVERGSDARMPSVTVTQPAGLATEKQVYFAASFYKKAEREVPKQWLATLTSKEMSALIDDLKAGNFPQADTAEEPF